MSQDKMSNDLSEVNDMSKRVVGEAPRRYRSQDWFDNPDHIDMTALYLERFMNYGITPEELRSGRPIIGIAQSGSDISPCTVSYTHLTLPTKA